MPIVFSSDVQELTYHKVADYLTRSDLFKDSVQVVGDRPLFHLRYGSAQVDVTVLPWEVHPWDERELAIVKADSYVTLGTAVSTELMQYLLQENGRMRFGSFYLGEAQQIQFAHSILGGNDMDLMELQTCILAVVTIADTYDDWIVARFGGQRAVDLKQS